MEQKHTNALIHETSPYLLQHAHNPVAWRPWGPEALRLAREQNKPIFLSIGYAACHWCHVMEHESFEDEEIARILNENFVPVKVDREERPDLDEIYMNATILFTRGHGGWPMSVWITPEGKPFYAGTYFPPDDYYGRPGFKSVLLRLSEVWRDSQNDVAADAGKVTEILQSMHATSPSEILPREAVSQAAQQMLRAYDPVHGGVGSGSNKFPPSMSMELLLREYNVTGNRVFLAPVELTLEKMARGGIYDHLGGGIHRYSTDSEWLVPHFEKMLYDQALVSSIYLDAYQVTRRKDFEQAARGICNYVIRKLQSPGGGLYSTEDADSEGKEGKFYIWTAEEVERVLGADHARLFCAYYDVTPGGNWHHPGDAHVPGGPKNILRILRPLEDVARQFQLAPEELERRLAACREKLFAAREERVHPGLDDKILTAWNGLMIASFAKAFAVLDEPRYREAAIFAAEFVLEHMEQHGRLLRSFRNGQAKLMAYIDDYAFFIEGLISLYEITGALEWLNEAERLLNVASQHYWDEEQGGFFFTASDHEALIVRSKLAQDSAIPSGNSVMVANLLRLELLLGRRDLREKAAAILRLFGGAITQSIFGHERMLCSVEGWHIGFKEVAIAGPAHDARTAALLRAARDMFLPNKVVAWLNPFSKEADSIRERVPLVADKEWSGTPTAYVCQNYACQLPTSDPAELQRQLQPSEQRRSRRSSETCGECD
ncbi:MAG: thioredoxin domain-containing protein [Acidobacteria bacterium]|nr:thioredoxin domain-containing protein [Acidobacteriota bacterium]